MIRVISRVLALCVVLVAAPAFAQLTDYQAGLLKQLPPPERVLEAVPKRDDALENAALQIGVLHEFNMLTMSIGPRPLPRQYDAAASQYWQAASQIREQVYAQLGTGKSTQARQAADQKLRDAGEPLFDSPPKYYKFRRQMFAKVLEGELREYALDWHDRAPEVAHAIGSFTPEWVRELPPALIPYVDRVFGLPRSFWLSLLGVWIILGIAFRTTPFHLLPDDVWTLQRGRQRVRMAHRVSTVVEVRESVEKVTTTVEERDGYNNPVSSRTYTTNYHHVKLFLKSNDGEHAVTLTNQGFNARQGHRILEVWDPKKNLYLFFYNYDLKTFLPMDYINRFVKMRPKILIPVWLLTLYGTFLYAPLYGSYAMCATPVVYLVFMNILNRRRRKKFKREMAREMIDATSASSAPGYIGTAEYGVAQA